DSGGSAGRRWSPPRQPHPLRQHGGSPQVLSRLHIEPVDIGCAGRQAGWRIHFDSDSSRWAGGDAPLDDAATSSPWDVHRWPPYTESALRQTRSGGTPYGASHVAGQDEPALTDDERTLAQALGKRVAALAVQLGRAD